VDTTERGDMGQKQAQIEDENMMTLGVTLLVKILFEFGNFSFMYDDEHIFLE
jgi:hypothetical protein